MKCIWVLWTIIGTAIGEKLDRTYLPPAGSVTSGGSQGAIDPPFAFPKYSITEKVLPEETEIAIGIDRVGPKQSSDTFENLPTPKINIDKELLVPINHSFGNVTLFSHSHDYSTTFPETFYNDNHPTTNYKNFQETTDNDVSNFLPVSDHSINIEQNVYDKTSPSVLYNVSGDPSTNVSQSDVSFIKDNDFTNSKLDSSTYPFSLSPIDEQNKYISSTPVYSQDNLYPTIDSQFTSTISTNLGNEEELYTHQEKGHTGPERLQAQMDREAVIINYDQIRTPDDYSYSYDTSNGIHAEENGTAVNGVRAKGSYSYIGDDGKVYSVTYTADENGFQPKGNHLPTPPPIPEAILKVIQQAEKQRETGIYDDGFYDDNKYGYRRYKERTHHKHPVTNDIPSRITVSHFKKDNEDLQQQSGGQKSKINLSNNMYQYSTEEPYVKPTSNDGIFEDNNNYELKYFKNDNIFEPQYDRNSIIINNTENVLSTEYPLNNNFGEVSIDSENDKTKINMEMGYRYFPPQNRFYDTKMLKMFPVRFSGVDQNLKDKEKENVTEKVTAKPFLTPYVTRKDDEPENYDSVRYNTAYSSSILDKLEKNKELIDPERAIDKNFESYMKLDQSTQQERRPNDVNRIISVKPGYFYAKNNLGLTIPTAFPSRFTATMTNDFVPVTSVRENTSFLISTTSTPNYFLETTRPGFIGDKPISGYSTGTSESDLISSTQNTVSGSKSEIYNTQFQSTTDTTVDPYIYKNPLASEKNFGENFNGPTQHQRFDAINGYYY